jgi:hypothetical protein
MQKAKAAEISFKNRYYEILVDPAARTWSARDRRSGVWGFKDARFVVDHFSGGLWREPDTKVTWKQSAVKTAHGKGRELTVTFKPAREYYPVRMLRVRLYDEKQFIEIGWGVSNPFDYTICVKNVDVVHAGQLFSDIKIDQPRVLKSGAGAEPNPVIKDWETKAFNGALLTFVDRGARRSLVAGGLAYSEFTRVVEFSDARGRKAKQEGTPVQRRIKLSFSDPQGKLIGPRCTYWSDDTAYLDFATRDPFEALEAYGKEMRAANNADPNVYDFPTLCGWMVSTVAYGEGKPINNSAGLVEQTRLARERGLMKYTPLAVRLEPDTYCYNDFGNTQQGWWNDKRWAGYGPGGGSQKGEGKGSLRKPYETFSRFCSAVAKLGGIPFTYFQASMPSNDFAKEHPGWMLNRDISMLHHTHSHHHPRVRYDYTNPGFRKHCLSVWQRLRKAGLKGVKFDYPETAWASGGGFADKSFTTTSAYRELFRLCREGMGPRGYIHERNLGESDVPRLDATAGVVDLQRVWGDASHFEPEMASRIGLRWFKARRVFLYYPDGKSFLRGGKELPACERRAFLTLIAFLSGRLEIGTSVGTMTDEMLHDMTRVFPMLGGEKSPRPADMLTGGLHPSVYVYSVTDNWHQVLFINNGKSGRKTISAPMAGNQAETGSLGLDRKASYHAFDFWSNKYLGIIKGTGRLAIELRGGEVAMVSVRKVEKHPQVVSTNRHIMQGMMECHNVAWSAAGRVLSGSVDVVGGEDFVLTIARNGWKSVSCDGAEIRERSRGLIEIVFRSERNATKSFRVRFRG